MQPIRLTSLEPEPPIVLPPGRRHPAGPLVRLSGDLALRAARRALRGLARGEPAPVLALGFSAGLLARAAVRGLAAVHHLQTCRGLATRPVPARPAPELLAVEVETLVVRTTRVFRRTGL